MDPSLPIPFPFRDVAFKAALSAGIGLLVGLEREWSQKEIGVRTFAIGGLLGMLTCLLAPAYVLGALLAILLLVGFLNVHSLLKDRSLELTTSICLVVVFFLGVLVGQAHYFTAATSAIVVMMLLSWKLELERFAGALRPEEIRSAVMLALLSVVIFPLLPNRFVDPWQLINPQQFWLTIVIIAGIGFLNYVLLRLYSTRGMYYAAVLGGLVNSTAAAVELSTQFPRSSRAGISGRRHAAAHKYLHVRPERSHPGHLRPCRRRLRRSASQHDGRRNPPRRLERPRRFHEKIRTPQTHLPRLPQRVLKFGLLFLILACAGTLAQRFCGNVGFLLVSLLGGLVSSASTTATAATLAAASQISPETAGIATILTSVSSSLVNLPLVYQQTRQRMLVRKLAVTSILIVLLGGIVLGILIRFHP